MAAEQLVVFQLGVEEYAFPIFQVKEIIQYGGATKLPKTPNYMEGIINLRGKVIPLVDLAKRFGVAVDQDSDKKAVIVEAVGQEVGIIVDEVKEVLRIDDTIIEEVAGTTYAAEFLRGIGKLEGRLVLILDLEKMFSTTGLALMDTIN